MVERGGFEPPKAAPADLQSAPFDRSGTSPRLFLGPQLRGPSHKITTTQSQNIWSWRWESNPQPADYKSAALPLSYASESDHYKLIYTKNQGKIYKLSFFFGGGTLSTKFNGSASRRGLRYKVQGTRCKA